MSLLKGVEMPQKGHRTGTAAVEFAVVVPVFLLLLLGIIEFGRAMMVQQMLTNATREGARQAALPEATEQAVRSTVIEFLASSYVDVLPAEVTITPAPETAFNNEQISVAVQVPYQRVSWVPTSYLNGQLRASTCMRSERLE